MHRRKPWIAIFFRLHSSSRNYSVIGSASLITSANNVSKFALNTFSIHRHLHRGRSISNDDLASSDHWDHHGEQVNGDDSSDWRRVSKIRRSFQSPKSSSPPKSSRPLDLPENSVSVSRIRQELENCRRLSTAMRNNHVDLVALDSILNGDDGSATPETGLLETFTMIGLILVYCTWITLICRASWGLSSIYDLLQRKSFPIFYTALSIEEVI